MANRSNINFNSIKVRLERSGSGHSDASVPFQFHKGTIRTHELLNKELFHRHFNSIKVRLEPVEF